MNDDGFPAGIFFGGIITFGFIFLIVTFGGMGDHHKFMESHPNIEDLIEEMREDCESKPGVVNCEWDTSTLDYTPNKER